MHPIASRAASRPLARLRFSSDYVCRSCLRRYHPARPLRQEAASAPVDVASADAKHDDRLLREIFDSPAAHKAFSASSSRSPSGLFRNRYLKQPEGFLTFANRCLREAQVVAARICKASTTDELARVIRDLDRLSDLLCRVVDLADFTRNTHPDERWVAAADRAFTDVYNYMNVLNTTTELYTTLKRVMAEPAVAAAGRFGEVERAVGRILLADFEKSGIALSSREKRRFISLSDDISRVGRDFVNTAASATPYMTLDRTQLAGLDAGTMARLPPTARDGRKVYLPVRGPAAHLALQTVHDESTRQQLYTAYHTASSRQIALLDELLFKRAELAQLVGRESYAAVTLADKMARTPTAVTAFLRSLLARTRPLAAREMDEIAALKRAQTGVPSAVLHAWDKDYYLHRLTQRRKSHTGNPDLSAYFSLGTVMQGLSRLFSHLYGVRFAPAATAPGEVWHDDVRRLDVLSDTDGHIAVVYCDLFQRAGKNPNPAHFTVRCSREILPADIPHDNDGMATAPSASGALYQLPTIALICDFSSSPSTTGTNTPPLLAFHEVTTLFHEMGHAIHSILGRTAYHEVAGTRCATDFAELPSILMEHFAHSPAVLALFARHHATDAPLPQELLRRRMLASTHLEHSETYQQALLALLDQELHAGPPMEIASSTRVYAQLEAEHALLAPGYVPGTAWQGFFTHLFGYGGLYYSYLLDKAIADRVWTAVFANDPLSRDAGERYREEVLRWGGARDPWRCVGSLLAREDLAEEAAVAGRMEEVGRWGIKEQIK